MPEQTWQPAEGVAIDTYLEEFAPANNHGGDGTLILGVRPGGLNRDILMQWDLSSIAAGSTIEIATLYLWATVDTPQITDANIARLLSGNALWTEMGCTYNTMDGVNAWVGGAGCEVAGTDFAFTNLWSGDPHDVGTLPGWYEFDFAVAEFQHMVDSGNYGYKFYATDRTPGFNGTYVFTSSSGLAANRPKLYVRWVEPSGRLVEYEFNVWDPLQRIIARDGHEVSPNEVRSDRWGKLLGFRSPSSKTYASLADGPDHFYISGVTSDGETVRITPDERLFADMLLKRITRG